MATGTLYVIATPLGNLGDLSPRAAELLSTVAVVAAEDTRHSRKLLNTIAATPRLISWHAHSSPGQTAAIVEILLGGQDVALITDAGTPAISDPGVELVARVRAEGVRVVPVPGPSAVATALSASGLPGDRYLFLGFLPRRGRQREELLQQAVAQPWSVVFFEAAPRLVQLLNDLSRLAEDGRQVVVARELTKLHEEIRGGAPADLASHYQALPPRGEVTVILAPGRVEPEETIDPESLSETIAGWLAAGESRRDLTQRVMTEFGLSRNEAYRLVMAVPQ